MKTKVLLISFALNMSFVNLLNPRFTFRRKIYVYLFIFIFFCFRANLLNHTEPLALSTYLSKEEDYVPLLAAMRKFSAIMKILPPTVPAYKYLQVMVFTKEPLVV